MLSITSPKIPDIALNMGITPSEVKEVIYQCASYVGFDNSLDAMDVANEVFATHGYNLGATWSKIASNVRALGNPR